MNRLAAETSPYLRQHRDNPVDWYPWGDEAFTAAAQRGVPVLLSVGYSACHWCHVMAHECFEDTETAALMNRLFVNVKVDREERPDVDAVYMDAVQAMTGRGGWPMTVFLTAEGEPFYGGTYFPRTQFVSLMTAIDDVWHNRPDEVRQNVTALTSALRRSAELAPMSEPPGLDAANTALEQLARAFDPDWGGFGSAPKFPSTMNLDLVARGLMATGAESLRVMLTTSLDAMASGGIYDHIGFGFARYSVDERWLVPHFEKMLYDQALFLRVYTHAAVLLDSPVYRQVAAEIVEFVLRDLRHPGGGLYSAFDADSPDDTGHGHEGLFHTWTPAEVRDVLGDDAATALDWFAITDAGNFEGRSIPSRLEHRGELLRPAQVEAVRRLLFDARERRPHPGLDDKVLTEWNGLFLAALCEAAAAFGRDDWTVAAVATGEFLLANLALPGGRWARSWHADGSPPARQMALAADHAALVDAFTRLAELTGQTRWIVAARSAADVMLDHFWDVDHGGLFTTADDAEQLVVRQKEVLDNATPGANSLAALALVRLAALTGERRYEHHADQILRLLGSVVVQAPTAAGMAIAAAVLRAEGTTEIVIAGVHPELVRVVQGRWLPGAVLAWGERGDGPLWQDRIDGAYVCRDHVCELPVTTVADLAGKLSSGK